VGLYLPQRWKRQPQGPVGLNRAHALAAGVTDIWLGSQPQSTLLRNFSCSANGVITTGYYASDETGRALLGDGGYDPRTIVGDSLALFPDPARCTVAVVRRHLDSVTRATSVFGSNNSAQITLHGPWNDGVLYWDYGGTGGSNRISSAFTKSLKLEVMVLVASPTRGREVWRNGKLFTSNSGIAGTSNHISGPFYIAGMFGVSSDVEHIYELVISRHEWSEAAIRAFSENPWQLLAPQRATFFSLPAASGPVLSLPTVIDITSTSVRPRVTITI
jgi:hypothetical protein